MLYSGSQLTEYELYQERMERTVDKEVSGDIYDVVISQMTDKSGNIVHYKNVSFSSEPLYEIIWCDAEAREYETELMEEDIRRERYLRALESEDEDYEDCRGDYRRDFSGVLY